MVLRTARTGRFKGRQFWGCSKFPHCRKTVDAAAKTVGLDDSPVVVSVHDSFSNRPERQVITMSRISAARCPRAYFRDYVELPRPEKPFVSIELAVGQYFHSLLERLFEQTAGRVVDGSCVLDAQAAVREFAATHLDGGVTVSPYRVIRADRTANDYLEGLGRMIGNFNRFAGDDLAGHTVVRAEGALEILAGTITIRGKYDLITRDEDGRLVLWDWKTGGAPSPRHSDSLEQLRMQLGIYATWMRHWYADETVRGRAVFFRDEPAGLHWEFSPQLEREVLDHTCAWRHRINGWTSYPPNRSALCAWCGWNEMCD